MTSKDIYSILSSKPHNPHYLNRYWKFIQALQYQIEIKGITEEHHICPKSHDLFPEYKSLKRNPWNGVHLTKRQHFISHWILAKAYKGKQIYAFWAMCNAQSPKDDRIRAYNISSKVYEQSKNIFLKEASKDRKGKATYKDTLGNSIYCSTNDPRVLSGELVSTSSGRKYKPRSKESKKAMSENYAKRPQVEKQRRIEKIKLTNSLKSEEEIRLSRLKMSNNRSNRTKEQKEITQQKRKLTQSLKSEEIKKAETLKRVSAYKETIRLKKLKS